MRSITLAVVVAGLFVSGCKHEQTPAKSSASGSTALTEQGACQSDADCSFRDDGCFKVCHAAQDTVAPKVSCAEACEPNLPACSCQAGRCTTGTSGTNYCAK